MDVFRAILLGIVQGLLEFLPVSSGTVTGSFASFTGFEAGTSMAASAVLHAGTLLALMIGMRRSLRRILKASAEMTADLFRNLAVSARTGNREGIWRIVNGSARRQACIFWTASLPAFLLGFLLRGAASMAVQSYLYTATGFLITAVLLGVSGMVIRKPVASEHLPRRAWILGILQGVSVLPGVSRYGAVYAGAVLCGYGRKSSVNISYLLAVPFLLGGIVYSVREGVLAETGAVWPLIIGAFAAFFTGLAVFRTEAKLLRQMRPGFFAVINAALGVMYILLYTVLK